MSDVWDAISPVYQNYMSEREKDAGFDGNRTDAITHWFYPKRGFLRKKNEILGEFMDMTEKGSLSWVIFPIVDR